MALIAPKGWGELVERPTFQADPHPGPVARLWYPSLVRERLLRTLTFLVWAAVAGAVTGAVFGWGFAQLVHLPQVDRLDTIQLAAATRVLDRNGDEVASFAVEKRIPLKPDEIPDHLKLAIVAAEDVDFYSHSGVDPFAVLRAVYQSVKAWKLGARGGASTLTQQLALNLFLTREHTLIRKIREALLAIDIEKRYTKDQILTMYANLVFLGHGAYGVEAASRLYFGKPARALTLSEAALLAAIIPSPNRKFSPIQNPENALKRRNSVLARMLEHGFITREAYEEAVGEPLGANLHVRTHRTGGYYLETVRRELERTYGTDELYRRGLVVRTAMDPVLQKTAENAVREGLVALDMSLGFRRPRNVVETGEVSIAEEWDDPTWHPLVLEPGGMAHAVVVSVGRREARLRIADREAVLGPKAIRWTGFRSLRRVLKAGDRVLVRLPDPLPEGDGAFRVELLQEPSVEGALVAIDNATGDVLAMVGGFDFSRSQFNRATQARRQCGSAFKPFVYLAAFEQGFSPADTLFDCPFLLPDAEGQLTYCPKNYHGRYHGITTLRRALEHSYNATAVKLQQLVGGRAVIETAKSFGITTPLHPYASLALGSLEVRLVELTRAYAGFANLGEAPEPIMIREVDDRDGRALERHFPSMKRAAPPAADYLLVQVLRGVVLRGTGQRARNLPAVVCGKTGTTNDYTDAWFMGFSPRITVGVWVGRDRKDSIGRRMTGARAALPIWLRFMKAYLDGLPEEERKLDFPVPAGVVFSSVDGRTGLRATPSCPPSWVLLEAFLDGTEPTEDCPPELHEIVELPWPFQEPHYTPRPGEPMPTPEAIAVADERIAAEKEEEAAIH